MNTQLKKKHQISVNLYQKKKNFNFKNQQNRFKKLKHYKNLNLYYDLHNKIVRPHNWIKTKFIKNYLECLKTDPMFRKYQNNYFVSFMCFMLFYIKKNASLIKNKKGILISKKYTQYNLIRWSIIMKNFKLNSKFIFENRLESIISKIQKNDKIIKNNINLNLHNFYVYKKNLRQLSKLVLNKNITKQEITDQKLKLLNLHQTYKTDKKKICSILVKMNPTNNYFIMNKQQFSPKNLRRVNFFKLRKLNSLKGFVPVNKIKYYSKRNQKVLKRISEWKKWHRWIGHRYVAWKTKKPKLRLDINSKLIKKTFQFFWHKWINKNLNKLFQKKLISFYNLRWTYFYNSQDNEWKSKFNALSENDKLNFKLLWIKNDIKKNHKLYYIFLLVFNKSMINLFVSQFLFKSFKLFFKHSISNFNLMNFKKKYLIWARKRFKVFYKRKCLIIKKRTLWRNKPWWERRRGSAKNNRSPKLISAYHKNWTISQRNINLLHNSDKQNYLIDFFKVQKLHLNRNQINFWYQMFCKEGRCFDWVLFSNYVAYHWRTKKGKKKRFKLIRNFRYETFTREKMPIFKFVKFKRFRSKLNTFRKYWFYILGDLKKKNVDQILKKSKKLNNQRRRAQVVHFIKNYRLKRIINFDFIFEKRIDVILALFFNVTIYTSRKFIKNNWVNINGRTINNYNTIYKVGDIIQLIPQNLYHNLYFTSWFLFFKKRNFHYNHFIYNLRIFCIMIINKNNSQLQNRFIFRQKWIRPKDRWQFKKWNYQKILMTNSNLRLLFQSKI